MDIVIEIQSSKHRGSRTTLQHILNYLLNKNAKYEVFFVWSFLSVCAIFFSILEHGDIWGIVKQDLCNVNLVEWKLH